MNQPGSWKPLSLIMIHFHSKSASLIWILETWLDAKSEPHLQFCTVQNIIKSTVVTVHAEHSIPTEGKVIATICNSVVSHWSYDINITIDAYSIQLYIRTSENNNASLAGCKMFHEFLFAHFLFFPVTGIIMKLLRKFVCYIRGFQLRCTFGTALNIDAPLISGMHDTQKSYVPKADISNTW